VETLYGFHILRLEAKRPAEQLGFSDVKGAIKKDLETKRRKDNKEALMDSIRKKARIETYITE
jgi:parvulin-like peptidyl-prolyl isomerase